MTKIYDATNGDLSYQQVKAVGITKSLVDGIEGAQELAAYMARVSNPDNQLNTGTSQGLLKYCAKHAHWSIFSMVNIQLEVQTTRDIARQFLRHDSIKFQEFSQRYADPTEDLFFVVRELRLQDDKNRQNSIKVDNHELTSEWEDLQLEVIEKAIQNYKVAIANKVAKEQARCLLPEGNTGSRMYANCSLRSVIHYCSLRRGNGTQLEHIDLANKIWEESVKHFDFLLKLENKE